MEKGRDEISLRGLAFLSQHVLHAVLLWCLGGFVLCTDLLRRPGQLQLCLKLGSRDMSEAEALRRFVSSSAVSCASLKTHSQRGGGLSAMVR